MATVFFSWQSDTPTRVGRQFLEDVLTTALLEITAERRLELVEPERDDGLVLDRDTKGVAGSPSIVDTILKKIDAAQAFVADLTYVGVRANGDKMPNANVLIEYGWALKSLTDARLIGVMNTAYGYPPTNPLPFDLRHKRQPIPYDLPEDADRAVRDRVKVELVKAFKKALEPILKLGSADSTNVAPPFVPRVAADGRGRFRAMGERIGVLDKHFQSSSNVMLESGPTLWLRVWPRWSQRTLSANEIKASIRESQFGLPLLVDHRDLGIVRGQDGLGVHACVSDETQTPCVTYVFDSGEVWCTAVNDLIEEGVLYLHEKAWFECFDRLIGFMCDYLNLPPPYHWEAGVEGLKDLRINPSTPGYPMGRRAVGHALVDSVVRRGITSFPAKPANQELRPFVEAIYDAFGQTAPAWLFQDSSA